VTTTPGTTPHEGLQTLSPSRASDFKVCPQLFKFRSIDRIPEPPTIYQARGTTAHLALQRLFDLPPERRTPEALYDLFRDAWVEIRDDEYPELFDSIDEERKWGIESLHLLANYFTLEDPTAFDPIDRELDMLEQFDGMVIRGILDRMEETAEGLVISDYKTGKAPPARYALPAFFALKIYALMVRKRFGRTPVALQLIYLNGEPTRYRIPVTDAQLDGVERKLLALWRVIDRAITESNFPARTGPLCDYCSYRDICPAWSDDPGGP
jgi:putative RecB family exonuclease